jgi:O-antigen ligase
VVAVVVVFICWIPFIGAGAALIALILGVVAWVTSKSAGRPISLAVAATILSILTLLAGIAITIGFMALVNKAQDADRYCLRTTTTQAEYDQCFEDRVSSWFGIEPSP